MEKIYMEDSSRKSSKSRSQLNLSVVLSFVVAFFAIFSLMACGISQVSYAAPQNNLPSREFTFFYQGDKVEGYDENNTDNRLSVNLYYSDSTMENPIFCIEHNNQHIDNEIKYIRDKKITDNGLVYILEHSYVNDVNIFYNEEISAPDAQTEKYVESWATQAAIWYYLYLENGGVAGGEDATITTDNVNYMSPAQVKGLENANKIRYGGSDSDIYVSGLGKKVAQFVDDVRTKYKNAISHDFSIVNVDQELDDQGHPKYTLTEDGQYYQSNVFSMTSNDNPVSYTVTLTPGTGTVEGAFICDASGNPITGALNPEDSFYVRIPVSSVSENESKHVNVNVKAQFDLFAGYEFLAADHQRVVSLVNEIVTQEHDDALEIIGAPDTSMTTAQTIYFIGLVVLLCGIGIVYANAKPAQSKQ